LPALMYPIELGIGSKKTWRRRILDDAGDNASLSRL
jgi:hypothetical protein